MARATFTGGVLTDIGSFGACFALPKMRKPVLISSVDGVGTKLKIAFLTGRHDTIGEDLVNHCVNDIAVQGASRCSFWITWRSENWTLTWRLPSSPASRAAAAQTVAR